MSESVSEVLQVRCEGGAPQRDGDFDVVIVGAGPGGYAAALYGASAGLRVALIERDKLGGTCLQRGCVPAKALLETASMMRHVTGAGDFGIETAGTATLDFTRSQGRKDRIVSELTRGLRGLLEGRHVEIIEGTGTLLAGRRVRVTGRAGDSQVLQGANVILATGSEPLSIPGFDIDGDRIISSDGVFSLESVPSTLAVIGGGAVGVEFASLFSDLGSDVTILEMLPSLLPGCDEDVSAVLQRSFKKRGIQVRTSTPVEGHALEGDITVVEAGGELLAVERVIVAVGRRPVAAGAIDPESGVEVDEKGYVVVDPLCHTGRDGIWAIGDVIATPQLAHVAFAEAILAIRGILREPVVPIDYSRVPWAVYSHPEVAFAGLTERKATELGFTVRTTRVPLRGNSRARVIGDTEGMVKLVVDGAEDRNGRILGVHIAGPWATEMLPAGYLAVNWEATASDVASLMQAHPTLAEAFGEAAIALTGRRLHAG